MFYVFAALALCWGLVLWGRSRRRRRARLAAEQARQAAQAQQAAAQPSRSERALAQATQRCRTGWDHPDSQPPGPVDVADAVRQLAPLIRDMMGDRSMVLIELAPEAPSVRAVQDEVECILLELALRARAAMPDGGRFCVWLEVNPSDLAEQALPAGCMDGCLRVRVRDSGPGLFGERADSDASAGAGLSIVRERMERAGGTLQQHSGSGEGTTVELYWPVLREHVRASPSAPSGGSHDPN